MADYNKHIYGECPVCKGKTVSSITQETKEVVTTCLQFGCDFSFIGKIGQKPDPRNYHHLKKQESSSKKLQKRSDDPSKYSPKYGAQYENGEEDDTRL